ncbi:MAG: NYN domain-containing protein [Anaerolineales bacterium]|nr:NYN domain-containing protein [Anaerolineales bacterium]
MPYLIDGHNLIGKLSSIDLADPDDEQKLIQLLREFLVKSNKRGTVFFDQAAPGGSTELKLGRLRVRFVRPPRIADQAIRSFLGRIKPEATNYIVVSSDRELQGAAKQIGARWMSSEEFASIITTSKKPEPAIDKPQNSLTPQEIDEWEKLFDPGKKDK